MFLFAFQDNSSFLREEVAQLYRRTGALVLRRCRFILKDEAAAEDVFQEVFVRVMRHWSWESEKEIPLSWLYRTAERCCFDRMRKYKREPIYNPEHLIESLVVQNGEAQSEAALMLTRFFSKLKPKLKQLVLLRYVDGLTQEQIAEELGWTRRTVGRKLKQLSKRVKNLSEQEIK